MSSKDVIVSIKGVSKAYSIDQGQESHVTLAESVFSWLRNPWSKSKKEIFWALDNVSFDVRAGEIVAIVGSNGSGKSTLLKIISRITEPTAGRIQLYGRVGSLLEVGTGFHPELTGRENVFLNGTLLGMSRQKVARQFDAIVAFAAVERFIDTPVKRYSSGMYMRLAFAVAAHLESEILLVDEVLAVGDTEFQAQCLKRIKDAAKDGRAVIFVSHQPELISKLSDRAVFLKNGRVAFTGSTSTALQEYERAKSIQGSLARRDFGDPLQAEAGKSA
jgi:lipopolysaccharide transport system ATP-binding protein